MENPTRSVRQRSAGVTPAPPPKQPESSFADYVLAELVQLVLQLFRYVPERDLQHGLHVAQRNRGVYTADGPHVQARDVKGVLDTPAVERQLTQGSEVGVRQGRAHG